MLLIVPRKSRLLTLAILLATFGMMSQFLPSTAHAQSASASDWRAGNIIDDSLFYNGNDMTASEVQAFLNSKVSNCSADATCLKDYSQSVPGYTADSYCGALSSGYKSSAQIIQQVSNACGIGSKVLLVLLQKEQALVTNTRPTADHYQKATGFACPDTAPCDSQYAGFFNQVYRAARQYKVYRANPNSYRYKARQNNQVQYHPNISCGSNNIYIENDATAGLYIYTPYQPNTAALNNLYGTGDGCSSYGNRNFWRIYTGWFNSTRGALFEAQFHSQSPSMSAYAGETKTAYIQYKNNGQWDWHDDQIDWPGIPPIHLAATAPINRSSIFSYGWPSVGRPNLNFSKVYESNGTTLAANQHLVKPGQIVRFEFNISIPWTLPAGQYREHFQPVLEGADGWNIGGVAWLDISVQPTNRADFNSQSPFPSMPQNSTTDVYLQYQNNGNTTWYDDSNAAANNTRPVHLAASGPVNRVSDFGAAWPSGGRPNLTFTKVYESNGTTLATNQHVVLPNQIARFYYDSNFK